MRRTLLTGATGFLGRELLVRLLATRRPLLVTTRRRGADEPLSEATRRLLEMVDGIAPGAPREALQVAFADVREPGLALSEEALAWLREASEVQIIHGAAEVRFDLPWEVMHRQNVLGTAQVVALARQLETEGRRVRLDYVSTAFVAGDRADLALEKDLDVGQQPRNAYERSKLAAEGVLRRAMAEGLSAAVHRPSIIVGDSRTGRASSFKVLYWPLKIYARGRWRTIIGRPDCTVDAVPVDFVADAMMVLLDAPEAAGGTFHLVAGPENQSTIGALAHLAQAELGGKPVKFMAPETYFRYWRPLLLPFLRLFRRDVAGSGAVFLPYLARNPSFDNREALRLLAPRGLSPPRVEAYFREIVRYAVATDFGQRRALALGAGGPT
jgi:long-chain acyl-CoA synthetase